MGKLRGTFAIALCCLYFGISNAQIDTLELDSRLVVSPNTCDVLRTGTTQSFFIGSSCGADIRISPDRGVTFVHQVSPEEFASGTFQYTFNVPGEYVIFCNVLDPDLVITSASCYIVADPVPLSLIHISEPTRPY